MDVSVIIPTYNRLWCLPRAIESCRNTICQTEIIVVDDGSSDGTWEWLQTQKDIKAVRQNNQGQTYAANYGTSIATGQYIRFLDSDDFLTPHIIDAQYQKAVETNADLIYSKVDTYIESSKEIRLNPEIALWDDFMEIQLSNRYGSHYLGMLFHRKLVEAVPRRPDFSLRDDRMFLLEVCLLNPKIAFVEGCAGYWVKHDEQMQANYQGLKSQVANWQTLNIFKKIIYELEKVNALTNSRKKAACTILWPLAHWIAKNHLTESSEIVKWIYQLDPDFKIPEKGFLRLLHQNLGFKRTQHLLKIRRSIISMFK